MASVAVAVMALSGQATAACGDVTIAEWNWASGELMANVDKVILSKGYGCNVELVPGATTTTFASMNEKGQPDIAGELWINAVREPLKKATAEGRLHTVNAGPITGLGEGWWIPPHTAKKHPELKTVLDVLNTYRHAEAVFRKYDKRTGECICCNSLFESLRALAAKYDLNLDSLLEELEASVGSGT